MKPVGRPPFEITEEVCKKAESLAAQGLNREQIASVLGMGKSTLFEKLKEYPEFMDAITVGKAKGITQVTNALFKKAVDGDVPAQKYYLNNRDNANWKDRIDSTVHARVDVTDLTEDELDRKLAQLERENEQSAKT